MRQNISIRPVFNRKVSKKDKKAFPKNKKAIIQLEVTFIDGVKSYMDTAIRIPPKMWNDKLRMVENDLSAPALNQSIDNQIRMIRELETKIMLTQKRPMRREDLKTLSGIQRQSASTFAVFIRDQAEVHKQKSPAYYLRCLKVAREMDEVGIKYFSDLSFANVLRYDAFLSSQSYELTTKYNRHKIAKKFVHIALKQGMLRYEDDPYKDYKPSRGRSKVRIRLDDEEIKKLVRSKINDSELCYVRDLFVLQIHTGIAHRDLMALTAKDNLRINGRDHWIEGLRKKSGEYYSVFLLPPAEQIIKKYKRNSGPLLPQISLFDYNRKLKVVAAACKIDKNLSSYVGRHTAASMFLRNGVALPVIQAIFGHSSIETTGIYARMEPGIVKRELLKFTN